MMLCWLVCLPVCLVHALPFLLLQRFLRAHGPPCIFGLADLLGLIVMQK